MKTNSKTALLLELAAQKALKRKDKTPPLARFCNLSAAQMESLVLGFASGMAPELPLKSVIDDSAIAAIPFLNALIWLLQLAASEGRIPTDAGDYITDAVKTQLRERDLISDITDGDDISIDFYWPPLGALHGVMLARKLVEPITGGLALTDRGRELLNGPRDAVFRVAFECFVGTTDWATADRFEVGPQIQEFAAYSFWLLARFGDTARSPEFYAEKFLRAFPAFIYRASNSIADPINDDFVPKPNPLDYFKPKKRRQLDLGVALMTRQFVDCYSLRTFERAMTWLGLVLANGSHNSLPISIRRSALFDEIFKIQPPPA